MRSLSDTGRCGYARSMSSGVTGEVAEEGTKRSKTSSMPEKVSGVAN